MFAGRVQIVDLSSGADRVGHGRAALRTHREIRLRDVDLALEVGTTVALRTQGSARTLGRVVQVSGSSVVISIVGTMDRRRAPRTYAEVALRYLELSSGGPLWVRRWIDAGEHPHGHFHTPDPLVDFSETGIRFRDANRHDVDHMLLMALSLPNGEHRVVAEVVRVEFIPVEERTRIPGTGEVADHRTAARFVEISPAALDGLRTVADAYRLRD